MSLLSFEDALARVLAGVEPVSIEDAALGEALDRTLARDVASMRTQPPWDSSAMDGYAVRTEDVETVPARLDVIAAAPAGHGFSGTVGPGQAVRIFTGAPVPEGADTIVLQEDADRDGDFVVVRESSTPGRFIRRRGLDFVHGDVLLEAGRRLAPRDLALAAAMNHARLPVRRRPSVAILATGDELVPPGGDPGPHQIVASNSVGVAAIVRRAGGWPVDLGIAPDDRAIIASAVDRAVEAGADILVTLGGASVGEHDLVQPALAGRGMTLDFWKIAMRPGKPLMFGRLGETRMLGLPGNPVSSLVCARLFLVPLIATLLAQRTDPLAEGTALLATALPRNDHRQDYLRADLSRGEGGALVATPFSRQDSSMLATLARSQCLIVRPPHAPAAPAGAECRIVRLEV